MEKNVIEYITYVLNGLPKNNGLDRHSISALGENLELTVYINDGVTWKIEYLLKSVEGLTKEEFLEDILKDIEEKRGN